MVVGKGQREGNNAARPRSHAFFHPRGGIRQPEESVTVGGAGGGEADASLRRGSGAGAAVHAAAAVFHRRAFAGAAGGGFRAASGRRIRLASRVAVAQRADRGNGRCLRLHGGLCAKLDLGRAKRVPPTFRRCNGVWRHGSLNGEPWAAKTKPEVRHDDCFNAPRGIVKVFASPAIAPNAPRSYSWYHLRHLRHLRTNLVSTDFVRR